MRLRLGVVAALAAVACAITGTARAGTALIVTGHGWGHGVGMSQWGAYGYALHGWKYHRILSHYYPGTTVRPRRRAARARPAHAGSERRHRRLRGADARDRREASDAEAAAGDLRHRAEARLPGAAPRDRLLLRAGSRCSTAPARRSRSTGASTTGRCSCAATAVDVSVVNALSLDTYLRGVVPSESPSHWPLAALEAQAVAARSYAVVGAAAGRVVRPAAHDERPGLRRRRGGAAALRQRRVRDARPGADVGRPGGADVLLLELGRPHRGRAGRLAGLGADPVPALGAGSVRHLLAASRLGAVRALRDAAGRAARARERHRVGARRAGRQLARRVGGVPAGFGQRSPAAAATRVARALHLLSNWFSVGELS